MDRFESSSISWGKRLCCRHCGPLVGSIKGDITFNCCHPSLATGTRGDHTAFYFLLEMRSAQMYKLLNIRNITLIFDGPCSCWNRLTIDSEWSKMLQAACKVAHNSCSCSSNVLSWIFLDICFMTACSLWRDFHRRNTILKHSYNSSTWYSALLLLSIKRKEILGQTEMEMRQAFFLFCRTFVSCATVSGLPC